MALTDHDTLEGLEAAAAAANDAGYGSSPASFSCQSKTARCVWWCSSSRRGKVRSRTGSLGLRAARDGRNARIVERLVGMGIDITLDEVQKEAGGGTSPAMSRRS